MADAASSFQQSNFLGGEFSPDAQGRIDLPQYRTALNSSLNGQPVEEGSWKRRSGRRRLGDTYLGSLGVLRTFWAPDHQPVICEMTFEQSSSVSWLRFWTQQFKGNQSDDMTLLCDNYAKIVNISTATPAVLTIAAAPPNSMNLTTGWESLDEVQIYIDPSIPLANGPGWINRTFMIEKLTSTTYALYDNITEAAIDGSEIGFGIQQYGTSYAGHVVRFELPYTTLDELRRVRLVQTGDSAYLLSKLRWPTRLTQSFPAPSNAVSTDAVWFTLTDAEFFDGPYLDALPGTSQTGNSHGTIFKEEPATNDWCLFDVADGAYEFQASDIGRMIRIWCQPQPWVNGSDYTNEGNGPPRVTYQGNFWALNINGIDSVTHSNKAPGINSDWYIQQDLARWGYGIIKEVNVDGFASKCYIDFLNPIGPGGGLDGDTIVGNSLQANGNAAPDGCQVDTWQLGVYTTNQYPACGTYHEGRLWLAGALPNRLDGCMSDGGGTSGFMTIPNVQNPAYYPSSTTSGTTNTIINSISTYATWGTSQSLSGTLGSEPLVGATVSTHQVFWCPTNATGQVLDNHGVALVLNAPEQDEVTFMHPHNDGIIVGAISGEHILAAGEGGVITPSSAVVRQVSKYGGAFIEAIRVGAALVFVQSYARRVMEYVVDFFSRRFVGHHLNEFAKHLTTDGILETAYQEESAPTVWLCTASGELASCTYRRLSIVEPAPTFAGWSRYELPDGRYVMSLAMGANQAGTLDQLVMLTSDTPIPQLNPIQPVPPAPLPPPPPSCCAGGCTPVPPHCCAPPPPPPPPTNPCTAGDGPPGSPSCQGECGLCTGGCAGPCGTGCGGCGGSGDGSGGGSGCGL